jgi:hypothetical protein
LIVGRAWRSTRVVESAPRRTGATAASSTVRNDQEQENVDEIPIELRELPFDVRREMNDDRRRRFGQAGRTIALLCECADPRCLYTVMLSAEQYDEIRPGIITADVHASKPLQH